MKLLFSLISLLTTSGGIASVPLINSRNNTIDYSNNLIQNTELSIKNISELSSISKLKTDNQIPELSSEKIDNFEKPDTALNIHFSSTIYANYSSEQSDITVATNTIKLKQPSLGSLYKTQIDLSNEHQIYTEVNTHFSTNAPTTTALEIAKDTSSSTCKIQKKSTPPVPAPTNIDTCSYGWNIIAMTVEDKISQILTATTTPPATPPNLSAKYQTLITSKKTTP